MKPNQLSRRRRNSAAPTGPADANPPRTCRPKPLHVAPPLLDFSPAPGLRACRGPLEAAFSGWVRARRNRLGLLRRPPPPAPTPDSWPEALLGSLALIGLLGWVMWLF